MFLPCCHVESNPEGRLMAALDGADGGASGAHRRRERRLRALWKHKLLVSGAPSRRRRTTAPTRLGASTPRPRREPIQPDGSPFNQTGAHSTMRCGADRPLSYAAGQHPAGADFRAHHGADRRRARSARHEGDRDRVYGARTWRRQKAAHGQECGARTCHYSRSA